MATKATTADLNTSTAKTTEVKEAPAKTTAEEVAVNKEANKKETAETETVKKEITAKKPAARRTRKTAEKKSAEDRVADLDKKIKQMQAQKRAILQREKEAARKARTKRLIRIGAEVEAYCGEITDLDAFKDYLQQYSAAIRGTQKKEQKDSRYDPDDLLAFLGQDQETQKKL